jgi:hypothetical protein
VPLPTGITNRFGYDIEFDSGAKYQDLTIDFEAIAEHLYALHQSAATAGVGMSRVIFDRRRAPPCGFRGALQGAMRSNYASASTDRYWEDGERKWEEQLLA